MGSAVVQVEPPSESAPRSLEDLVGKAKVGLLAEQVRNLCVSQDVPEDVVSSVVRGMVAWAQDSNSGDVAWTSSGELSGQDSLPDASQAVNEEPWFDGSGYASMPNTTLPVIIEPSPSFRELDDLQSNPSSIERASLAERVSMNQYLF